ncbi:MAG: FecR family protein [Spirosomataceae bacterium]
MKDYKNYEIEDFLEDDSFREWVRGDASEDTFWASFLQRYPQKSEPMHQAKCLIWSLNVDNEPISDKEVRAEVSSFLERIETDSVPMTSRPHQWWLRPTYQMVATIVLLLMAYAGWQISQKTDLGVLLPTFSTATNDLAEAVNDTQEPLLLVLNDGSRVQLSPRSRLRYAPKFTNKTRDVYLIGEAIFEVTHQSTPFLVHTGPITTKVLGTRFVVSAYQNTQRISVQVKSGKVSVYENQVQNKATNGVILTTNQAAIFDTNGGELSKTLVAQPVLMHPEVVPTDFEYDEVPLSQLLQQLEKAYGIPIQYNPDLLKNCRITAILSNESLYEKLNLLCKITNSTYEIVDGQIVFEARNCQ